MNNKLNHDNVCEICGLRTAVGIDDMGVDVCDECREKSEGGY